MAAPIIGLAARLAFRRSVIRLIRGVRKTSVRASRKGALLLQRRMKRWALRHYKTGFMRRNIIVERTKNLPLQDISRRTLSRRGLSRRVVHHRVTIPRHRFRRFYYPYQFRQEWARQVRRHRRAVLREIRRAS